MLGGEHGEPLAGEPFVVRLALLVLDLGQPQELALGVEAAGEEAGLDAEPGGEGVGHGLGLAAALGLALGAGDGALAGGGLPLLAAGVVEADPGLGESDGGVGALDGAAVEDLVDAPRDRDAPRVAGPAGDRGVGRVEPLGADRGERDAARGDGEEEVELGPPAAPADHGAALVAGEREPGALDAERRLGRRLRRVGGDLERRERVVAELDGAAGVGDDLGGGGGRERDEEKDGAHGAWLRRRRARAWNGAASGLEARHASEARSLRKPSPRTGAAKSESVWLARVAWKPAGISA